MRAGLVVLLSTLGACWDFDPYAARYHCNSNADCHEGYTCQVTEGGPICRLASAAGDADVDSYDHGLDLAETDPGPSGTCDTATETAGITVGEGVLCDAANETVWTLVATDPVEAPDVATVCNGFGELPRLFHFRQITTCFRGGRGGQNGGCLGADCDPSQCSPCPGTDSCYLVEQAPNWSCGTYWMGGNLCADPKFFDATTGAPRIAQPGAKHRVLCVQSPN